jgi:hypothetical protein
MIREKILLNLLAEDLRALHSSALALEGDLRRLSLEICSDTVDSLAGLIAQINCAGFAPIESLMKEAGIKADPRVIRNPSQVMLTGVLAEARHYAGRAESGRIGAANAISVMRRAARYMEMYCTSLADSATRLRLSKLAGHLRAWAREWIGLELNLNAVAARPHTVREAAVAAA